MKKIVNKLLVHLLKPQGKLSVLYSMADDVKILDVGCGNEQVQKVKRIVPDCYYVGIDVADYYNTNSDLSDEYHLVAANEFSDFIYSMNDKYDLILSSHNLEHCNDRYGTLAAMCSRLSVGGTIFISTPAEITTNFPSRPGTLNYYDDETHVDLPVRHNKIIEILEKNNIEITFSSKSYKPKLGAFLGMILEPFSIALKSVFGFTWMYWGFEQIIIGKKH
jgi:2-polyprenyl-3-methyl-5-hydroxy-6-metoxy-1,4-benzoquinol methylase